MTKEEKKQMGLRIKKAREKLGYSQDELAEKLKMKRANISNYESGRATPPSDVLRDLAYVLNVSTDFILGVGAKIISIQGMCEGEMIRQERIEQGYTQQQLADLVGVSQAEISQFERDILPIPSETFEKLASAFGMSTAVFLDKYNSYEEYIPESFNGDVDSFESFKSAVESDVLNERLGSTNATAKHGLNSKEDRDIAKEIEEIMSSLDCDNALAFDGAPLTEEDKELLRASLEHSLRTARIVAKQKFTPKKYRK